MRDRAIEQFEQEVFRKPYASVNNNILEPIKLSYIWSEEKGLSDVIYSINPSYHIVQNMSLTVKQAQFKVTRNIFDTPSELSEPVDYSLSGKIPGFSVASTGTGVMSLKNAYTCYFSATLLLSISHPNGITIKVPLPFNLAIPVASATVTASENIYSSTYGSSLSKNKIINNPTVDIKFQSSHKLLASFLKKEFNVALDGSGDFVRHVENGTEAFADIGRVISQVESGEGVLSIPKKPDGLDPVILTTILTDELSEKLFAEGLEEFLSSETQSQHSGGMQFDFKGAYGEYYWELFFHIPFLIASHLNANQKFKEAKWWYERIFNPTAERSPEGEIPTDRNWQFREFKNKTIEKLKDILIDEAAIEAYKTNPFNPHAIARLRFNAYQKSIVMKYIDNLIDWGDHLFAQDTRESINEANMLYQLAAEILGERPVEMGECETAKDEDLTFEQIGHEIDSGSEFLIALENYRSITKDQYEFDVKPVKTSKFLAKILVNSGMKTEPTSLKSVAEAASFTKLSDIATRLVSAGATGTTGAIPSAGKSHHVINYNQKVKEKERGSTGRKFWNDADEFKEHVVEIPVKSQPGLDLVEQGMMVFCVPANKNLLKYWDRVEDRLFKIRHCMNISGMRRSLVLFQPPINPMMLVRARAAGMSLEDILPMLVSNPPLYRFIFLNEKARQFAQTVQGFGAALLSALEKKDVEELTLLRSVHERNILRLTKDIKKKQLQETQHQFKAMEETLVNVQNRIDYYTDLIAGGLTGWEFTQQASKHIATRLVAHKGVLDLLSGFLYLLPQLGSPFAITFGGKQVGDNAGQSAKQAGDLAAVAEAISASAGLVASNQRREQEWKQQLKIAEQEFKQVETQVLAAEIRSLIIEKDLVIHEESMEQANEMNEFYKNKFSNLGLYNYLASTLTRLHRDAYNVAYDMAKMAERAYHFEQDDDTTIFIANDNWQFDRAGLLAGETLQLQLQKMEQAFITNNSRTPEITQSFALSLLQPFELVKLRQTGTCEIKIPEIAFEALYPGQYKRLIKSVSLTIPCVVGPFTNVSAKLTMLRGELESADQEDLTEINVGKGTSITTSSANNDVGMFEFNFRDERYLPFEGCGAISEWKLELPSTVRSFNYNSIHEIILTLRYTAKDGNRAAAEATLATTITDHASDTGLFRLFSLKHEFPNAFHQLLDPVAGANQTTGFLIEGIHFPYLFIEMGLNIVEAKIYLKPKKGTVVTLPVTLNINGFNNVTWDSGEDVAMPATSGSEGKIKGGTVSLGGDPKKQWTIDAGAGGLDANVLEDLLIWIRYKIT
jgi:hypothetical protein